MEIETVTAYRAYYIRLAYGDGEIGPCFASRQLANDVLKLLRTTTPSDEMPVISLTETKSCELFDAGEDYNEASVRSFLSEKFPSYVKSVEDALTSYGVIVENSI